MSIKYLSYLAAQSPEQSSSLWWEVIESKMWDGKAGKLLSVAISLAEGLWKGVSREIMKLIWIATMLFTLSVQDSCVSLNIFHLIGI